MAETIPIKDVVFDEQKEDVPTSIPIKDVTLQAPKRPSDPGKQAIAGLSDIFTGLPIVAGLAGQGLEAIADYALDDNDKTFPQTFAEAGKEGADKALLDLGLKGRTATNEALGIKEAQSTEDQAARLLTSMIFPGSLGTSLLGKAATFLTPLVRTGKGFTKRAGVQLGVGTGIDQGIRAAIDDEEFPLLFSKQALTGELPERDLEEDKDPEKFDTKPQLPKAQNYGSRSIPIEEVEFVDTPSIPINEVEFTSTDPKYVLAEEEKASQAAENASFTKDVALGVGALVVSIFGAKYLGKVSKAKIDEMAMSGLSPTNIESSATSAINEIKNIRETQGNAAAVKAVKEGAASSASTGIKRFFGNTFDKTKHNEEALRAAGVSEDEISQLSGQEIVDVFGVVEQFLKDGKMGQGSAAAVRSLKSIKREYDALPKEQRKLFIDGIGATREDIIRTRATAFDVLRQSESELMPGITGPSKLKQAFESGTVDDLELILKEQESLINNIRGTKGSLERVKPGLWTKNAEGKKEFYADSTVKFIIKNFNMNPNFVRMQKDLAKINEAVLDEAVRRGAFDKDFAAGLKKQFTKDGSVMYLPGKENVSRAAWYKRLATNMGFHTSKGKNLNGVGNWHLQGLTEGSGIASPLDPFQAMGHYAYQVMDHVNTSSKQWNFLSRLTGLRMVNNKVIVPKVNATDDATVPVKYVGSSSMDDPLNQGGNVHVNFSDDIDIARRFDTKGKGTFTPQQLAQMDDVIWVQRGSTYHGFLVSDRQLKKSLEFDAGLHNRVLKFGNFWKNVFTKFTTGNLSPFGVISFLYNNQVSAFNAALQASKGKNAIGTVKNASREAFETWKDSYKGAWELFSTRMSEDISDMLTRSMQNNTLLFRSSPDLIRKIRILTKRKVRDSLVAPLQRETGRSASGLGASEFQGNLTNVFEEAVPYITRTRGAGALPQMWRIWNHLNTSLQEGTALGITMRKARELADKNPTQTQSRLSREARRIANDIVGDVRLRGSSDTGKAFHALVPFSGAMLQAWSTLGRSMKKGGVQKTLGTVVAAVGIPTALEVTYNNTLDDETTYPDDGFPPRNWTYKEYFWEGFSADQRNNNHIFFIPGKPPWEAILIPVTPEISLFRGFVIDAMETIGGLSDPESGLGGSNIKKPNHFLAGLSRVFDIALPPPIAAAGSALGLDLRAGILPDDTKALGFGFFEGRPMLTGQRVTGDFGRTKYVGGEVDKEVVNILQDVFGAGGALAVGVYEAFNAGNESTPLNTRIQYATDELGRNIMRQARYVQPLFGKALRNNPDQNIVRSVLAQKDALQRFSRDEQLMYSGGGMSGDRPIRGNTVDAPTDPVHQMLIMQSKDYLNQIKPLDDMISDIRKDIATIGAGTQDRFQQKEITLKERDELVDSMNLQIQSLKALQLTALEAFKEQFKEFAHKNTGRDMSDFSFETFKPNPNPSGSVSPGLPNLPRTSE